MKKYIVLLLFSFILFGCTQKSDVKGEADMKGSILEIDKDARRILVEDYEKGLVWVTLNETDNMKELQVYQEVAIWIEGAIAESYPGQAKALHVEIIRPKEVE
ncbi:DUF3221 domain-containing protein [Bacillus sp. JJ1532]|uniref:DUF3221 domain-containing protein n=1 Tax=Bacillus sp. JJ1532 TaxID=3122958 RepID=UPI002FFF2CA3